VEEKTMPIISWVVPRLLEQDQQQALQQPSIVKTINQ
jgi:hypothetical protein